MSGTDTSLLSLVERDSSETKNKRNVLDSNVSNTIRALSLRRLCQYELNMDGKRGDTRCDQGCCALDT